MSRIRSIKPDFFLDDELGSLSPLDRLLFIGLWTQADREGRLADRPKKIKASILPYDSHDADKALDRLAVAGFIIRYETAGHGFIQVVNFLRHQCPNVKELPSTIPAPCQDDASTSLLGREGKGTGKEGKDSFVEPKESSIESDFDAWYADYPKKEGKQAALKAYRSARKKVDVDTLRAGLARSMPVYATKERQFIPNPATWLNQGRWDDDYAPGPQDDAKYMTPDGVDIRTLERYDNAR